MNFYDPKIHHRRSIRLKGYDYGQKGAYFITICCQHRAHLFGIVKNGKMELNEYGKIAHQAWLKTPEIRKNVTLGAFIIMPNHMHGIIIITDKINRRGELNSPQKELNSPQKELNSPQNDLISPQNDLNSPQNDLISPQNDLISPKNKSELHSTDNENNIVSNSPPQSPSNNIGAIVRGYKSSVTKQLNELNIGCVVWQRNYHENIIRDEQAFQNISNYIINNPAKWAEDKFYKK